MEVLSKMQQLRISEREIQVLLNTIFNEIQKGVFLVKLAHPWYTGSLRAHCSVPPRIISAVLGPSDER